MRPGILPDLSLSVAQSRSADVEEVISELEDVGFEEVSTAGGGKFRHYETSNGFGVTVVDGLFRTSVIPAGLIRGRLMGAESVGFGVNHEGGAIPFTPRRSKKKKKRSQSSSSSSDDREVEKIYS